MPDRDSIRKVLLVAIAYAISGKLSLLLAIPPGFASPVFPPAGIAFATSLLFGNTAFVGIWIGSFSFNLWTSMEDASVPVLQSVLLSSSIATGSCLQAWIGAVLTRRNVSLPLTLTYNADILKFLVIGVFVTTISSTFGSVSLLLAGEISPGGYAFNWWNWWVGDTIGLLIFAPVLFAFFAKPRALWAKRLYSVVVPLMVIFTVGVAFFVRSNNWKHRTIRLEFERAASNLVTRVEKSFDGYLDALHALKDVLVFTDGRNRSAFHSATEHWLALHPGIYDFAWLPRVRLEERRSHESLARRDFPKYEISEQGPLGKLVRSPDREEYFPSRFVEPFREQETVVGYDLFSNPERRETMARARDSGVPATSAPLKLVQNISDREAVVVFLPVYRGKSDTLTERRENLWGFISAVVRMGRLIEASTQGIMGDFFKVAIYDRKYRDNEPLYSQFGALLSNTADSKLGTLVLPLADTPLSLADRTFTVSVRPTQAYWDTKERVGPWLLTFSALAASAILVGFLLVISGQSFVTELELTERTRISEELARSNAELEQYAGVASHDLQEPLRMISTYLQLVQVRNTDKLDEDSKLHMDHVIKGAARMRTLIDDLLNYSKVGRTSSQAEPVDIKELLEQILVELAVAIGETHAEIEVGPMPTLYLVRSEAVQLFQNLLSNALKYRRQEVAPKIFVVAEPQGEGWLFSIRDNGIGIGKEFQERIFRLFQRLHGRNEFPGTGIGLAICKKIVERHGGRIWVESTVGQGSNFLFTLS